MNLLFEFTRVNVLQFQESLLSEKKQKINDSLAVPDGVRHIYPDSKCLPIERYEYVGLQVQLRRYQVAFEPKCALPALNQGFG